MQTPSSSSPPVGLDALRAATQTLPSSPGCYQMIDAAGTILYIGKAKSLANRVASYTNVNNLTTRILRMVNQVARVETTVTQNEAAALLLESSLIKRHMPRYNVLLKDDKSFPYIRVDTSHPFPRIEKHRGAQSKPGEYFGPFANVHALNQAMALLQKIFLLRPCADTVFANRSRPCLQYQIKRCSAPCVGYVSETQYREQLDTARDFLKGKHRDVQVALAREMSAASEAQEYEKAALLRDRIRALTQVQQEQGLRISGLDDADVIALARRGSKSAVQVHFYRSGSAFGHQSFYPRHEEEVSDAELLQQFLGQFYQAHLPPPELLLGLEPTDSALLAEALTLRAGYGVALKVPQRGDKRDLLARVQATAEMALQKLESERTSLQEHLARLQTLFGMDAPPKRIEVYDNSHIGGSHAVGAFIVATSEGFDKKSYRSYNIQDATTTPGDDYAMMREVIRRRFKAGVRGEALGVREENALDPRPSTLYPDLLLIDGGIGQLHAVEEVLAQLGITGIALVAIAKGEDRNAGREWFYLPGKPPFQLPVNAPALHYLQRLRDEAHRFVIGRHRSKRSRSLTTSALDDIPGIGPGRKRALLQHFGSRRDVETATLEELAKVTGISKATARAIYDYFHG
jgi:excinuclease ABC subunit C